MAKRIRIGSRRTGTFTFCGVEIVQDGNEIALNQRDYIASIPEKILLTKGRQDDERLTDEETGLLRTCLGKVAWVANNTAPQAAYQTSNVAQRLGEGATVGLARSFTNFIKWMKKANIELRYRALPGDPESLHVETFGDGAFAKQPRGFSQLGVVSCLVSHATEQDQGKRFNILH